MAQISNVQFAESLNGANMEAMAKDLDVFGADTPDGFRWIQTVVTNDPLNGTATEYVDQGKSSTPFPDPFYNRTPASQKSPGKFEDFPQRHVPGPGRKITWNATLTLIAVDLKERSLITHDIRTYGFELTLMKGTQSVADVVLAYPTQKWAALFKHIDLVRAAYPSWDFSNLKFRKPAP